MDNQHWTNDPDLLERFVLNRLESVRREELENHLKTCEQCRIAVREEQELAAGVRHLAREEFKAKLKQGLQAEPVREIPWFQLAAAAAMIVILIGVGIYNDWFTRFREKHVTEEFQHEQPASSTAQEQKSPPAAPQAAGEPSRVTSDRPVPAKTEKRLEREASAQKTIREASRERQIVRDERMPLENAAGAGAGVQREDIEREQAKEFDVAATRSLDKSVWVEGVILPKTGERALPLGETSTIDEGKQHRATKSELQKQAESETGRSQRITVQQGIRSQIFMLSQRPKSELPVQQARSMRTIPTLIERTEEGLQFTLYLDQPVRDEDLRSAIIEPIHQDSVVLHLGSQQIGYHIPGGWFAQSPAKNR